MKKITDNKDGIEYDKYLEDFIESYCVTKFLGRGQYSKDYFTNVEEARSFVEKMKQKEPNTRVVIYWLSRPPHATELVSIAIK